MPKMGTNSKFYFSKDKLISYLGKLLFVGEIRSFASKVALIFCHSPIRTSEIPPINAALGFLVTRILAVMLLSENTLFLLPICFVAQSVRNENGCGSFSPSFMLVQVDILSRVRILRTHGRN